MGFGIMFFGFMITYLGALTPLYVFTYAIGSIIILFSLKNLVTENKWFLASAVISSILEVISLIVLVFFAIDRQGRTYDILSSCQTYASFILLISLLVAIYIIAKQVGLVKIQSRVIANAVIVFMGIAVSLLATVVRNNMFSGYAAMAAIFCRVIYTVFTLVILFNCYVRICYAGDEDMSDANTGMNVLNTLNSKLNSAIDKGKDLDKKGRKK